MKNYKQIEQTPMVAISVFSGEVVLVKSVTGDDGIVFYAGENGDLFESGELIFSYENNEHNKESTSVPVDYGEFLINLVELLEKSGVTKPEDMCRVTLTQAGADHINGEMAKFLEEFPDLGRAFCTGYFVEWSTFRLRQNKLVDIFRNVDCGFTNLEKV